MGCGVLWVLIGVVLAGGLEAVPQQLMYPYGREYGDQVLPPEDDISSDEISLSEPVVFFDTAYKSLYVNMNGHVSFETEIPNYQGNLVLPIGFKMIAPFLGDVDTRVTGTVYYRETDDENTLRRAAADIQSHFSGKATFQPSALFIVTWDKVGYYNEQYDKVNTFQLVLVTDGESSFAFFHYLDGGMQWVTSQGKLKPTVPDVPGQAGFDRGDGYGDRSPTLPFSGSTAAFVNESNVNIPGVWMFQIGNTGPDGDVKAADLNTGKVTIYEVGVGQTCLEGARQCHTNARCLDYDQGFCCQCLPPYYGNGKHCLEPGEPQRLNGRVHGMINEVALNDLDMHTYVVTTDGRTYTAISRVPTVLGRAMETLSTVGGAIGWLFAVPVGNDALNGFQYTGGVFNRTAVVNYQRGNRTVHSMRITQRFFGQDALNNLRMDTHLEGDLPDITAGSKVTIDDYVENYKRVGRGLVKSFSVRTYRVNDVAFRYTWDQTLTFEECEADPNPNTHTMRLAVSRNFVRHSENDQVVRYAMSNKVSVLTGSDPCVDATHTCHEHADCVPSDQSFRCVCRAGFQGSGMDCQDIDECAMDLDVCDQNARCFNVYGSFQCQCLPGYRGDGRVCTRDQPQCSGQYCGENARCVFNSELGRPQCECNTGFRGDGVTCVSVRFDCNEADICGENAECVLDEETGSYVCQCIDDFSGDGINCQPNDQADCHYCSRDAECIYDIERLVYRCQCRYGYTGDGVTCSPIDRCGECDANADCNFDPDANRFQCQCRYGFYGDGDYCQEYDCRETNVCAREAVCDFDVNFNAFLCRCPAGYAGDGFRCEVKGCDVMNDCDVNARCVPDPSGASRYVCQCLPGFQGDGKVCQKEVTPCNQVNNCDEHAECVYDPDAMSYRCHCQRGYEGDGYACQQRDAPDCRSQPSMCDRNAACVEGAGGIFVCVCNHNYRGDGRRCTVIEMEGERLLYARGSKVFIMSTSPQPGDFGQQVDYRAGQLAVAVDMDCVHGEVYWTDAAEGFIRKAAMNGTNSQLVLTGLGSPEGLAIDPVSRVMYYTDSKLDEVGAALLDGSYRKTLFNTDMVNPRAIVLDSSRGKLYWTDWNRNRPQIETSNMDGSERRVLVSDDLRLPNGLAFDHFSQQLCWADAGTKRLECMRSDGLGRRIVSTAPSHPFGLTMLNSILYWTDWERKHISGVSQTGGEVSTITPAIGGNGRLYGIKALKDQCPRGTNSCAFNNGGCAFLCLPTPSGGRTCACPDGIDPRSCQESNTSF
ncbi:nidogen-1-like [Babylonia areolata]|uniref:nidogen-1-like n=1 Tax=Babylonia areolata TaxID=304850 RepID=UPI003FD24FE7